jgi:hypothetical protein
MPAAVIRAPGVTLGCLDDVTDEELAGAPITYIDGRHDNMAPPVLLHHL